MRPTDQEMIATDKIVSYSSEEEGAHCATRVPHEEALGSVRRPMEWVKTGQESLCGFSGRNGQGRVSTFRTG